MSLTKVPSVEGIVFGQYYLAQKRIGHGSFGEIYLGRDIRHNTNVALKLEVSPAKSSQLYIESKVYNIFSGMNGFPKFFWYGVENGLNILVIELLGNSVDGYFEKQRGNFSLKTVLMIADQMLRLIEAFHSKNLIHRDIKPENFLFGCEKNSNQLFLIDFGLSKFYCDPISRSHCKFSENHSLTGTARYASINALAGIEQSRRDDLEAIGYVLVYLMKGKLPWQGLVAESSTEKHKKILEIKQNTDYSVLCEGIPSQFMDYFAIVRELNFAEEPPYSRLRNLFTSLFIQEGYIYDYSYDWTPFEVPQKISENNTDKKGVISQYIAKHAIHPREKAKPSSGNQYHSAPTIKTIPVVKPQSRALRLTTKFSSNSKKIPKKGDTPTTWTLQPVKKISGT